MDATITDTTITIDSAGRVVLPKPLRDHYGLHPGSELELRHDGTEIHLRPVQDDRPLKEVNGFLVYAGRSSDSDSDAVRRQREVRLRRVYGR